MSHASTLDTPKLRIAGAVALLVLAAAATPASRAATYKWVDEKGVVHYTDKIPPEAVNKANVQLDKQGVPVKKIEPAPTAAERKAKADEEVRQTQLAKERELVDRRDRALLSTYTTESEIDLARKRALATIEQQIQSSSAYVAQLTKRKTDLDGKKAALGTQPVPPVLERELTNITNELDRQSELQAAKQKEMLLVNVRYDADRKRWRELREATEAQMNGRAPPPGLSATTPTSTTAQK